MSVNIELSSQDADLFIKHIDDISWRFTAACERAEAAVAETIGADCVPKDVNRIGEDLISLLDQMRHEAERQFACLRKACTDAIAAGETW
jgi:hypothetical protein